MIVGMGCLGRREADEKEEEPMLLIVLDSRWWSC